MRSANYLVGVVALLSLSGMGVPPSSADAQELNPPTIEELRVGFNGQFKIAAWTPVEVTLQGGSQPLVGEVKLILPDGDGTPSVVSAPRPVQLLPGRKAKVLMYAKFGRRFGDLQILLQADGTNVIARTIDSNLGSGKLSLPTPLQANERLIVTLGASVGVQEAARLHQQATGSQTAIAVLNDSNELPTEWYGYDGVDWLVISTSQPDVFATMQDTGARRAALEQWIALGGKLLLVAGSQAPTVLAPDAPLAAFAPGRFVEPATLRRTTDLESFVGSARKVRTTQDGELALSVPKLEKVAGRIEVADGNLPLVIRTAHRFGQVVFVGVDLDRQPFVDWDGRGSLVARLLGFAEPGTSDGTQNNQNAAFGSNFFGGDLLAQLRGGLDNFTGVTPISFAVVAALILGYIVLIGPGDYLLVKRVLKRMELTWITFPIWVVLVSAGAYALAVYTKGDELRLNQVDLVDVDVESGWARGTSWLNVFSPQSEAFDLSIAPHEPSGAAVADSTRLFAWMGSGEMDSGGGAGTLFSGRYAFSPSLDEMLRVPIQVWSTKGFVARSSFKTTEMPTATITLGSDSVPEGSIRNELSIPLSDCLLLSGDWAYVLGDLPAGATARLKPGEQRDLRHVLREAGQGQPAVVHGPGGARGLGDVKVALDRMMFFDAAREGEGATAAAGSQQLIDMSDLLDLDRAILIGRSATPAAQLTNAGKPLSGPEDQHWTVYRFVFPVSRATAARP